MFQSQIIRLFALLYSISIRFGFRKIWDKAALADPYLRGSGYSLLIADRLYFYNKKTEALNLIRKNILTFIGKAYPMPVACDPDRLETKAESTGHAAGKHICLRDLYTALEQLNVKPFLAFGTLLGFVREGGFIRSDGDIDIGIPYNPSDFHRIADRLAEQGFLITRRDGPEWPCRIKCIHANGTEVDVVFFCRSGAKYLTYCDYRNQRIIREREYFELKRAEFQSHRVWIPENPEKFLEENYLDWKVPQAINHHLFTSALTDYKQEIIRYFAVWHLYRLLTLRNRAHFEFFLSVFAKRSPTDQIWTEIQTAYQSAYS